MPQEVAPDRWHRLEKILVASWDLPHDAREAFWASQAEGDESLVAELRELSAARDAADSWSSREQEESSIHHIGPYVLDRLIGRGGMGAVYLAHRVDGEFEQQVAVKVIALPFEIEAFRDKFRRERQILAGLKHPNIAHLLDGGTTEDGALYIAMEYVEGVPIDQFAAALPLTDRLKLFREVCAGVAYSHQHLVVHCDIKPSNILVTKDASPKLLDFGAAKLVSDAGADNATRLRMMTVAYASPEQLAGEPASTLSDVFSLGSLLFEMVTGHPAFGGDLLSRAQTAEDERAPNLPRSLPGDLERVVRKALATNPMERYCSVEQLSEDVRRYLAAEPVMAHPPALSYRAGKFIRRHRLALGFAAASVAALIGMTIYSLYQARIAQTEAARAQAANRFLTTLFQIPFSDTGSRHDMTVRELLDLAERRVTPSLGRYPEIATDVDVVLGRGFDSQQARDRARAMFERALERARRTGDVPRQATAISLLATVAYETNQVDRAWRRAIESASLWKQQRRKFTPEQAVEVLVNSGQLMQFLRPADAANREYLEEAARLVRQYRDIPAGTRAAAFQALAESRLNWPGDGVQNYRAAYPLIQEALAVDRADPSLGGQLLSSLQSWGRINRFLGHNDVDEAAQHEAYELTSRLFGADHMETARQRAIWAYSLAGVGRIQDAYAESQAALVTTRRIFPNPGSFQLWTNTAVAAYTSCRIERYQECEALAREALETLGPQPQTGDVRVFEAKAYLGLALAGEGRNSEAIPLLEQTIEFYRSHNRAARFRETLEKALDKAKGRADRTPARP